MTEIKNIRNFSIIAHIDHGKSTLADRILEFTQTIAKRDMRNQVMDGMELERERGITIKAKAVRIVYQADDGQSYLLNLIDTPGHVDFTYEVSRALAACEGTLLVVDASQGVEAQTLANNQLARDNNLVIIPVINKIDLPQSDIEGTKKQIREILGISEEPILVSAKEGIGTKDVLSAVVKKVPAPGGDPEKPLAALIFDSVFDPYRGVIIYIRVIDGVIKSGMPILMVSSGEIFEVEEIGFLRLKPIKADRLGPGEVGYCIAGIKDIHKIKIGDTITDRNNPTRQPHPGYRELKPFVFCGLYPVNASDYQLLSQALDKLHLTDSSFFFLPETSSALGFGFRCGFLGLLHMDIIKERLEREFGLNLLITAPNVIYRITAQDGEVTDIDNPSKLPPFNKIKEIAEPYIYATIIIPAELVGGVMGLCQNRRSQFVNMQYLGTQKVILNYEIPLAEVILDFYDQLKSISQGYASFDYEHIGFKANDLVRLDILINQEPVDALSFIVHEEKAYYQGRKFVEKLRELIPRQLFEVPIQARINNKIIARESVRALRKDVLAKCYGGDITRKRKLLEKQKEGKRKMKQLGKVEVTQDIFWAVLKINE